MSEISLEKLYQMQCALDERIIRDKKLEDQNLMPNTVVALVVELGEWANEGRWFKHWSNDREPRTRKIHSDRDAYCETNPLLEEYVDCVHFYLSIARQNGWIDSMYISEDALEETREQGLDGGISSAFLEAVYWLLKMQVEREPMKRTEEITGKTAKEFCFANSWYVFIAIGMVGFDFTWKQISEAYVAKNATNHERQSNGY